MRQVFNPHTGKPDYIVDPDTIARSLYGLGVMVVVAGPMVAGTDPPQMAPSTAVQVAHLLSIGIPEAYIGWSVTGSETGTSGSFTLPSVTLTPVITAPSLSGLQGGGFALPSVTLQPQVVAPTLTGVQVGAFALPTVTMQPQVSAPTLFGVQAGVGVFALPSVTLQPQVTAPTLAGVQVGSFALPAVTIQPQVSAPSLAGLQVGTFALPSVTIQPQVTAPSLAGPQSGSFALPAVTLQPVVTAPTLAAGAAAADYFGTGTEGWTLTGCARTQDAGNWTVYGSVSAVDDGDGGFASGTFTLEKNLTLAQFDSITLRYKASGTGTISLTYYLASGAITLSPSSFTVDGQYHTATFTVGTYIPTPSSRLAQVTVLSGPSEGNTINCYLDDIKKNGMLI